MYAHVCNAFHDDTMTATKAVSYCALYARGNNGLQWTDNYFDAKGSSCIIENVSKHLSDFNSIFSLYTRCILSRGKGLAAAVLDGGFT